MRSHRERERERPFPPTCFGYCFIKMLINTQYLCSHLSRSDWRTERSGRDYLKYVGLSQGPDALVVVMKY